MMLNPEPAHPDTAGPPAGRDYLIRSEERLAVRTERVLDGWVRLEKFVVTETRTFTVELSHEEVRVVHLSADPGQPKPGVSDGKNGARWMYVNREELVITKKVVPVERVRLEVYPVTEQQQITEAVRKEQITDPPTITTEPDARGGPDQT
jgi:uncharacterized protein (TIGR02271 family)